MALRDVLALGHFCEKHGPSVIFVTERTSSQVAERLMRASVAALAAAPTSSASCAMCRSFGDGAAMVSAAPSDGDDAVRFVSRRFPDESSAYARVRTACVRALSCEICPGREGAIMFGDDDGTCLSYAFRLRDSDARGFARWYAIILLSVDVYHVAACHATLSHYMRTVVRQLKLRVSAQFADDMHAPAAGGAADSAAVVAAPVAQPLPSGFRKEAASSKLRSLAELTQCPTLFGELHAQFAWILCAYRTHFFVKPPPLIDWRIFPRPVAASAAAASSVSLSSLFDAIGDSDESVLFSVLSGRRVLVRFDDTEAEERRDAADATVALEICRTLAQLLPSHVSWPVETLTSVDASLAAVPQTTRFVVLPRLYVIPPDVSPASYVAIDILQCAPLQVACAGPTRSSWLCVAMRDALLRRAQLSDAALLRLVEYVKASWCAKCELHAAFVKAHDGARGAIDAEKLDRFLGVVGLSGKDLAFLSHWAVLMSDDA